VAHTLANRTAGQSMSAGLMARLAVLVAMVALCLVGLQQSANAVANATASTGSTGTNSTTNVTTNVTVTVPDQSEGNTISWEIQGSGFRAG
jgi:hypothetical protein